MRFQAPARGTVDPSVFARPPLQRWHGEFGGWLEDQAWPQVAALNAALPAGARQHFVHQDPALLADGLHYEARIALQGAIATRAENWHDLFNAMIWLRHPRMKWALNRQQMLEIGQVGPRARSRVQCALTHFDEAGVMVRVRDPALLALWDRHDWQALFWTHREAWADGRLQCEVFGHALLEHALVGGSLIVGKALVLLDEGGPAESAVPMVCRLAEAVDDGRLLRDPQELRPLPLSGIPGWHPDNASQAFYRQAACFRPLRPGRRYPPPLSASAGLPR